MVEHDECKYISWFFFLKKRSFQYPSQDDNGMWYRKWGISRLLPWNFNKESTKNVSLGYGQYHSLLGLYDLEFDPNLSRWDVNSSGQTGSHDLQI